MLVANKIALGQIDVGIAGGADTTTDAPVGVNEDLRQVLLEAQPRQERRPGARSCSASCARARSCPTSRATPSRAPACRWASTPAITAERVGHHARGRRTSSPPPATSASPPPTSAASSTTSSRRTSGLERDQNLRPDSSAEKLAKLKPVFGEGEDATMTAGNSTPLTDGAAVVLLASDEWAAERSLPGARPPHARRRPRRSTTSTATRGC